MPPNRPSQAPAVVEWDDPRPPTTERSSRSKPKGSALASPLVALLALFLIPVSGSVYYALTTSDQYTGQALVQFRPRATDNGGVVGNETTASSAAGYGAFLGTPSTVRFIASQIGVRASDLRDNMTVQLIPATTSLRITFEDSSPAVAARGASALAQVVVQRATDDPLVSATVLAPAAVPDAPSTPPTTLVVAAGTALGALLAAVAYFLLSALKRTRGTTADAGQNRIRDEYVSSNGSAGKSPAPALSTR